LIRGWKWNFAPEPLAAVDYCAAAGRPTTSVATRWAPRKTCFFGRLEQAALRNEEPKSLQESPARGRLAAATWCAAATWPADGGVGAMNPSANARALTCVSEAAAAAVTTMPIST